MGNWVSVDEELPDFEEKVLVFYQWETRHNKKVEALTGIDICHLSSITKNKHNQIAEFVDREYNGVSNVTHWQPLPKPPLP